MAQDNLSKIVANFKTNLATNLPIGSTTATIQTNVDRNGVTIPDGVFTFSIAVNAANIEQIICDKVGTTISNIRSVDFKTRTYTVGTTKKHQIGEPMAVTDYSSFGVVADLLNGVQGLDKDTPLAFDGALAHTGNIEEIATIRDILSYTGTVYPSPVVTVTGTTGSTPATTLTIPVVVSGTNPALIVSLSAQQSVALTSITCNGIAVPTIASKDRSTGNLKALIAILSAPTTGNVVITMASAVNMSAVCTIIQNYNGVQVAGMGSEGSSTAITSTVTSTGNALVIDAIAFNSGYLNSVPPPQNLVGKVDAITSTKKVAQSMESIQVAGVVQTDYTSTLTTDWASISVALETVLIGGFLRLDGTNQMLASLNFGTQKGINLVDPTNPQDVASKAYVDSVAIAGAPNADYVTKGIVERATQAEVDAGTEFGSTGAALFINPKELKASALFGTAPLIAGQVLNASTISLITSIGDGTTTQVGKDYSGTPSGSVSFGDGDAGIPGTFSKVATQVFLPTGLVNADNINLKSFSINRIKLWLSKTGSPVDNIKVSLQLNDTSGVIANQPNGIDIVSTTISGASLPSSLADTTITIPTTRIDDQSVWVVVERTGAQNAVNYYNMATSASASDPDVAVFEPFNSNYVINALNNGSLTIQLVAEDGKVYISQPTKKDSTTNAVTVIKTFSTNYPVAGQNVAEGAQALVGFSGVYNGFTGLTQGTKYYAGLNGVVSTTNTFPYIGRGASTIGLSVNQSIV